MNRSFFFLLIMALISILILGSCTQQASPSSQAPAKSSQAPPPSSSAALSPATAQAQSKDQSTIKIGFLYPTTGPVAMTGQFMVMASQYALDEVGSQVAGKKIEAIIEDEGGQPAMAIDKTRKLIDHDKVSMIIGPLVTVSQQAVAPIIQQAGIPELCPSPDDLKMSQYPWYFMAGGSRRQIIYPMGLYAYDRLGYRKITTMTEDTVTGHSVLSSFTDAFKSKGGEVIQEQYAPFGTNDFAPYLTNLKDASAVVAWFQGADAIKFHTQYHDLGIRKRMPLQAAFFGSFVQPFLLRNLPPPVAEAMVGEYAQTLYTYLLEADTSKRFAETFKSKLGYYPDDVHATPYLITQVALKALEATKGDTTPDKVRQALLSLDFQSVEGRFRFDPETKCSIRDTYVCRIDKVNGQFAMVPVYTYKDVPPNGL